MQLAAERMRQLVDRARVARVATLDERGRPHLVPIVYVLAGGTVYSGTDAGPRPAERLRNLERDPRVTLLVDDYDEDWAGVWWVRLRGQGRTVTDPDEQARAWALLRAKYPQFAQAPPEESSGPVLAVEIEDWAGWAYSDRDPDQAAGARAEQPARARAEQPAGTRPDQAIGGPGPEPFRLRTIGVVRSPLRDPAEAPRQNFEGAPPAVLELRPEVAPALHRIDPPTDLLLLTWLDRSDREVLQVHPMDQESIPLTGVFATRSPDRPNPIGLHRVTVTAIGPGPTLQVAALEAIDGTPILDLKAVMQEQDDR